MTSKLKLFVIIAAFLAFIKESYELPGAGGRVTRAAEGSWCYDQEGCKEGSAEWKGICKNGQKQSPVDLPASVITRTTCPIDFGMTEPNAYRLKGYKLENAGKTIKITVDGKSTEKPYFRWPDNGDGTYTLVQVHFHWGETDSVGSEHLVAQKAYAMEMHLVHYRSGGTDSYKDFNAAVNSKKKDALAVIGFFIEPGTPNTTVLDPLIAPLGKLDVGGPGITLDEPFLLYEQIQAQTSAIHYEGSLTTPDCLEVVQWIVCKDPIPAKVDDIGLIRRITGQLKTYRSPQESAARYFYLLPFSH